MHGLGAQKLSLFVDLLLRFLLLTTHLLPVASQSVSTNSNTSTCANCASVRISADTTNVGFEHADIEFRLVWRHESDVDVEKLRHELFPGEHQQQGW